MLVWRFCPRGRLGAVLVVLSAIARPSWAASGAPEAWLAETRAELRARGGRPEAIAPLAALVQRQDNLPPRALAEVLRDFVDGKLGGPVDPLVAAQATYLLSMEDDRSGRFVEAERRREGLGFGGGAWVLGPFNSQGRTGLDQAFPVEEEGATLDPRSGKKYAGKERAVAWRRSPSEAFVQGALFVDALLRPSSDAVAYCLAYVHSDRDRWAALRVGSAGPIKAWLGGAQVLSSDVVRPAWPDQDLAPVYLRRGANLLVLKTVAVRGPWRLFFRLTDGRGAALPGVSIGAEPPERWARGEPPRKPPAMRELGRRLHGRATSSSRSRAAPAWLDYALFLSLVAPADSESRAVEEAAKRAVPRSDTKLSVAGTKALLLLGQTAREDDDRRAALVRALPALPSKAERADAYAAIGNLWRAQQRDDAAVAAWRQALALDPTCVAAQLAVAREERHTGMAATALARISGLPDTVRRLPLVQDALADTLTSLGRRREAESVREDMVGGQRTDVGLLRELASAARARGDLPAAARLYAQATRWRPDLTSLLVDQAAMLERGGHIAQARALLAGASRRLPSEASLPEELGRMEARAGRLGAALASMRRALELRPQNPELRRYLESLAAARPAQPRGRTAEDLAAAYAADGEALAREVLWGRPAVDDASAEVLLDRTVVRVHGNGLAERFVQRLVHARTERAARDSREASVRFEPGRQEVEIRKARILRRGADDSLEVSEATGRDEESLSEPWYGLYYDTRAAVVTFENVRAGDVVEVQYTVVDVGHRNEFADYFGDLQIIADVWPTRRWDYTLLAPSTRRFYFNEPRWPGLGPRREEHAGEVTYRFAAEKVPRVDSEPSMPGFAEVAPYLHLSTYASWEDVGRWYWNLVADQMQDDGSLKRAAVQATNGARSVADKVRALHRLVVEKTRYIGLEFGIHGYKPYKATQVLERRFGDCKDKATLLVTLLGSVGVDAELVLLRTRRGGRIAEMPASLAAFDHAIAYVPALDLYVDGTAEFSGLGELPAEDQDTMALRVSPRGAKLVRTPVLPAERNLARRDWRVDLRADGSARIAEDLSVAGQAAHEWRSYYQTQGERRSRFAKAWSGRFAGAQLDSVAMDLADRNRPVAVRSEVTVPQLGERGEGGEVRLPISSREANLASTYARLGKRRWPLVLGYPWRHEETVTYHLPREAHVVHLPRARKVKSPFGELSLEVDRSPASITIRSTFAVVTNRIAPEDYPAFRTFLRDADTALDERLVVALGRSR
jgi:tetratricopeptide (TPR) repeat protein/transglutaminase-like putative cysteine protease